MSEFWVLFIASFISGTLGAMGLGGGSVLIIYLTVFAGLEQLNAQGINLIFFIPIALCAVAIYAFQKQIKYKTIFPFILGGMPASFLGGYVAQLIKTNLLSKIFGGVILVFGLWQIFKKDNTHNKPKLVDGK